MTKQAEEACKTSKNSGENAVTSAGVLVVLVLIDGRALLLPIFFPVEFYSA